MQDLSLHILDVAENGVRAGATLIRISIRENTADDGFMVEIEDNGRGMSPEFLEKVTDPFTTSRTTRKVGLGLSLFQQAAREAGGDLSVQSRPGAGTKVTVTMRHSHIDRKPLGAMDETVTALIEGSPHIDFVYMHVKDKASYTLDTRELRHELGGIPMNHPEVIALIRENLNIGLAEVHSPPSGSHRTE